MTDPLTLLPVPRGLQPLEGSYVVPARAWIHLESDPTQIPRLACSRLEEAIGRTQGARWETRPDLPAPGEPVGARLEVLPGGLGPEAYELAIAADGVRLRAGDGRGIGHGISTLIQILEQRRASLPCLRIEDSPDFPARGVMLDISRDKVPTLQTLFELVDLLAGWKINQLQLYTEHTFAYREHPDVWAEASPLTAEEVRSIDAFCRERGIELVPNQNSFGHMQRWLKHPRYAPLAETLSSYETPWGIEQGPYSLCPEDPASLALIEGLYDELLPHFTSRMLNVGCDETFDLGQGRSRAACAARGTGRVYLDYLLKIHQAVARRGFRMQFWGDILIQHPELVGEVPKEAIALEWGYEAGHPFDEHGARWAEAGVPFYVCPGTSSWCSLAGRTHNALGNLRSAAENGLRHGAWGYLITDWGDHGHWQALPISFLGLAAGAAFSWCLDANRNLDIPAALSSFAFSDPSGIMGRLAFDLGNVYRTVGLEPPNSSMLFWLLLWRLEAARSIAGDDPRVFENCLEAIDQVMKPLADEQMQRADAALIRAEFEQTARLLRHACRRGLLAMERDPVKAGRLRKELAADLQEILPEYGQIWLLRNRPGGLKDSLARLEAMAEDYAP